MDKPVADKLNPGHDAAVRRMLATAPRAATQGTPPGRNRLPKVGSGARLKRGPKHQPNHSLVHRS